MQENFQTKRSIQERIVEILEIEGITPYKFCKDLGFSQGYLDKRGAIGTDKYLKIIKYLSDYNPMWILNEEPPMMKLDIEINIPEDIYNNKLIETQGKLIDQFEKRTKELEELIYNLKKGKKPNISHQYVAESPEKLEEKRKT